MNGIDASCNRLLLLGLWVFGLALPGWSEDPILATFQRGDVRLSDVKALWETHAIAGFITTGTTEVSQQFEEHIRTVAARRLLAQKALDAGLDLEHSEKQTIDTIHRHRLASAYLHHILDATPTSETIETATQAIAARIQRMEKIDALARSIRHAAPMEIIEPQWLGVADEKTTIIKYGSRVFDMSDARKFLELRPTLGPPFIRDATPIEAFATEIALSFAAAKAKLILSPEIDRAYKRDYSAALCRAYLTRKNLTIPTPSPQAIQDELNAYHPDVARDSPQAESVKLTDYYWGEEQVQYRYIPFRLPPLEGLEEDAIVQAFLENEARADRVYELIRLGQDMGRLAAVFGDSPYRDREGIVQNPLATPGNEDWLPLKSLDSGIQAILTAMEPGEISVPLPDPNGGVMILQLLERRREPIPADTRAARAKNQLLERARRNTERELENQVLSEARFQLQSNWWEILQPQNQPTPENP